MNAYTINTLDTLTNLIMLLAIVLPVYILGLSYVIGEFPVALRWKLGKAIYKAKEHIPHFHYLPILKISHNGSLRIITIRHPFTGSFLFSITTSHKITRPTPKPVQAPVAMFSNLYRFAMGMLVIWLLAACETPTNATNEQDKISTQYVQDGYSLNKACWWATANGDSLKVEGRKYTISERSRYRVARLDTETIDRLLAGDVWVNDWAFYRDTKRNDTVYVFNRCDMPNLGGD